MSCLHRQRRGVCDLKPENVRVKVADDGTFQKCVLLDLGGSVAYTGQLNKPDTPAALTY